MGLRAFAAFDSYLPTHPASLIPGLPQLAILLAWLAGLAVLWTLFRLLLSVLCTRFLHAHVSIGHVGWASLNDIEWSLVRHAKGTTTAKIQRVHIQRICITLRGRGAKDNDIRFAWLGLLVKGVTVSMCLVPTRDTLEPDSPSASDTLNKHGDHSETSPSSPRASTFSTTPSSASLAFSSKSISPQSTRTDIPQHTSSLRQLAQLSFYTLRTIHDIRRRVRRAILSSLPDNYQRNLSRALGRGARFFRHRLVAPLLTQINSFGRACNRLAVFLALEMTDITVEIPQIKSSVKIGLIRVGGEMVRRNRSYVGLWARLEQVSLNAQDITPVEVKGSTNPKTAAAAGRAIEMAGPLLIEAQANFDPSIGMAALYHRDETGALEPRKTILDLSFAFLRPSSTFGKDEKLVTTSTGGPAGGLLASSLKIRLNTLLEMADRVKETIDPHPHPHFGPHLGPHLHARLPSDEHNPDRSATPHSRTDSGSAAYEHEGPSLTFHGYSDLPPIPTRRNPAAMLKSISFSIPLIKIEARLPEYPEGPRTVISAPRQIQLEVRLRGLAAQATVSKALDPSDRHLHWFGRNAILKAAAKVGFEKFDIDAAAVGLEPGKPVRILEVSPSGLHLSSTWLPPRVDALFREPSGQLEQAPGDLGASTWGGSVESVSPRTREQTSESEESDDRSSGLTVMEADVGGVNGEASLEIVQGLLLVLAAHQAKKAALKETVEEEVDGLSESEMSHKSWQAQSPPTLAVVFEFGRCGYRVLGPRIAHRASFGPGEDDAELSQGFAAPSLLCVHIMSLAVTLQTRYSDVPVHRTEAQRRELKQEIKRGSIFIPNVLFRGSQSQRASELRAREARKRMFDSPRLDEDLEDWSQSTSPLTPGADPDQGNKVPFPSKDKAKDAAPFTASCYKDNDFLCFITPDDGRMPEYARRIAGSHAGGYKEVLDHPFVYFVDASITFQKVDVYLLSSQDSRLSDVRSNPTSASSDGFKSASEHSTPRTRGGISPTSRHGHTRRQSRPVTTKRHDILSIDSVEVGVALEVLGRELSIGEHAFEESAFLSLVDSRDTHGSVSLVCDGPRSEVSNTEVQHCLSAMLHLTTHPVQQDFGDDSETLASSAGFSRSEDSDPTATDPATTPGPATPLSRLLPPNVHYSVGISNIELFVAGPDPKFMPGTSRGLALRVAQLTLQRYRQDRYVASQSHAHVRAPLGLPPDLRAHAQSVFNETHHKDQAFVSLQLRELRVNPLKDSGKENRIMRAKPPVNAEGRSTTEDVGVEFSKGWKWCRLPRQHFFPSADAPDSSRAAHTSSGRKDRKFTRYSAARVRDFFFIEDIEARITFWTRSSNHHSSDASSASVANEMSSSNRSQALQDCIGLAVRIPQIVVRFELFQVYCFLLAFSALRSLTPPKEHTRNTKPVVRQKPYLQLKCSVSQLHLYWTLPHAVKLYSCLKRIEVSTHKEDMQLQLESGIVAGESHVCLGIWEDILKIRKVALILKKDQDNLGHEDRIFILKGDGARLRIPCKYPFSEIVDNLVTFVKLCKQLSHQFVKGKFSSAIEPRAEPPKHIPNIRIDLKIIVIEAADDPFEAKLNLVWNAGKTEQLHRLAREKLFEAGAQAIRRGQKPSQAQTDVHPGSMAEHRDPEAREDAGQHLSFQPDHKPSPLSHAQHASVAHAKERLDSRNSQEWIKLIRDAQAQRTREEDKHLKDLYGNIRSTDDTLPVQLLNHHGSTPLLRLVFKAVDIRLSKPSFDVDGEGLRNYMYDVGKGIPRETQYSLIIPFRLDWKMNEAKAHIRDYPIPLLDIPPFVDDSRTADEATQSWHLVTDFVIAEELAGPNSIRLVPAIIVPAEHCGPRGTSEGYFFRVPRTAMPVKFYAKPVITIQSDSATRISWGNSVQPAIQDVMRVMDSLTKPPPDPSERVGFWDKIRLILHWRIDISFRGKGPLHLILKGSRDPYSVEGAGAGFSLSWHDDVRWKIGFDNYDREFFQIMSDRFVLGIPDLSTYATKVNSGRMHERPRPDDRFFRGFASVPENNKIESREQRLSKVCAKFQGGVKWGLGMQFERTCRDESCTKGCQGSLFHRQCRIFDFKPHYEVTTISGFDATGVDFKHLDSYRAFRSDFIHFSISVVANRPDSPANSLHLTPNGFTHFYAWWHLFDGTLSLPVRHGPIFESSLPPSKKFGKHCATIKYRIQLAPVYIAHTFKQEGAEDFRKGLSTVLGVKGRLEHFNVDMHQREQETRTRKNDSEDVQVRLHKAFHRVEVDCKDTDLRVVSARFTCPSYADSDIESEDPDMTDFLNMDAAEPISPEDAEWVDEDDYIDLTTLLGERQPNMHLISCLKTPRLTYSRYAQHDYLYPPLRGGKVYMGPSSVFNDGKGGDVAGAEASRDVSKGPISKFGHEHSHLCLLDRARDALDIQLEVMEERVSQLEADLAFLTGPDSDSSPKDVEEVKMRLRIAKMSVLRLHTYRDRKESTASLPKGAKRDAQEAEFVDTLDKEHIPDFHVFQDLDKWINRLMIHNPNVVVSQRIRDILLRYYYSSRQARFFKYAMTAKAIKFIREFAKDTRKAFTPGRDTNLNVADKAEKPPRNDSFHAAKEHAAVDLLDDLLREVTEPRNGRELPRNSSVNQDSTPASNEEVVDPMTLLREQLGSDERSQNSFLVSVLKPQVCLYSELSGHSSTVVIASQAVQLRICAIIDNDHVDDPINAVVMHRSFGRVDALQAFYPHLRGWRSGRKETILSHADAFVPLELLGGLSADTRDLDTIVAPTNAKLTYDKNNRLRLINQSSQRSDDGAAGCDRTVDRFSVACDRFTVNATSTHFAAIYDVITNLILYTDPNQKARTQKIEQLSLSRDFSDSADIATNVEKQQNELRALRRRFHRTINGEDNRHYTSEERYVYVTQQIQDFNERKEVLTLWLGAMQASQDSRTSGKTTGMRLDARAKEITWHMREGDGKPLAKVSVNNVYFCWQNRSDGGTSNSLVIRDLVALNSGVDPYFSEIISKHPYSSTVMETRFMKADIFVAVIWSMLSPVGGIPIIDHFQVHLHPIRLQMEQSMADKIKHYFFSPRESKHIEDTASVAGSSISNDSKSSFSFETASSQSSRLELALRNRSTESLSAPTQGSSKRPPSIAKSSLLSLPSSSSAASQVSLPGSRPRSVLRNPLQEMSLNAIAPRDDHLDADDMRERARSNRTFLHVELFPTVLCLSFKGDKSTTLPDVYGLIYKSPTIIHCNRIWTYLDLVEHIKKDFKSSIWSQSATLLGQLLTSARKPKNAVQHHVQQRLLSHVTDKSGDRDRRRSLTTSIRSRLSSLGAEESKTSPLRSSYVRQGVEEEDSSGSDASESIRSHRS